MPISQSCYCIVPPCHAHISCAILQELYIVNVVMFVANATAAAMIEFGSLAQLGVHSIVYSAATFTL